jgi:LCP family protein required for cell wall assembly
VGSRRDLDREDYPREEKERGRDKGQRSALLVLGIGLFAAAAFYLALIVATHADKFFLPGNEIHLPGLSSLPGVDSGQPEAGTIEDRINFLVMGLDRKVDEPKGNPARTDTMFVVTVDPYSKTAGVFSIPRDLWVEIPDGQGGYFKQRINVAYEYGPLRNYPGGGPGLAKATIEHNFDIKIDYYVVLDFVGFMKLVDAVGGIDVNVKEAIWDPSYCNTTDCSDFQVVHFEPGLQHMDGERALEYVRIRYGSDDLKRIERQQDVIRATVDAALNARLLIPNRAVSIYNKFRDAVDTDVSAFKVPGLALLAQDIPPESITTISLASAVEEGYAGDAAVLFPVWDRIEVLKAQLFFDPQLRSEGAFVEVQNGTETPGLATSLMDYLAKQGFPEADLTVGDATDGIYHEQTLIYDLAGKPYTAKKLAAWLGLPSSRVLEVRPDATPSPVPTSTADIVVVLGADARIPETTVNVTATITPGGEATGVASSAVAPRPSPDLTSEASPSPSPTAPTPPPPAPVPTPTGEPPLSPVPKPSPTPVPTPTGEPPLSPVPKPSPTPMLTPTGEPPLSPVPKPSPTPMPRP